MIVSIVAGYYDHPHFTAYVAFVYAMTSAVLPMYDKSVVFDDFDKCFKG